MSAPDSALPETTVPDSSGRDEILRFRVSERQMHWAIAVPFMICYATAVVLVIFYSGHPLRPYRDAVTWIHRASGLSLFVLPLWTIVEHWHDFSIHRHNIREAWRWTLADVKWLFLMGPSTLNKKITLPEQGKFNAAEKINFMVLMATLPGYLFTGLLLCLHQYAFSAWVVHLSLAAMATTLLGGHIFMATVNPDTRVGLSGMITGFVDRHWASHHYGHWYRKNFADIAVAEAPRAETASLEAGEELTTRSTSEGDHHAAWRPRPAGVRSERSPRERMHAGSGVDVVAGIEAVAVCVLGRGGASNPDASRADDLDRMDYRRPMPS